MSITVQIPEAEPLARCLEAERNHRIGRAVSDLPQKQRLLVFLHYYEDRPLEEIADVLQITPQGVARLHVMALQGMRAALV